MFVFSISMLRAGAREDGLSAPTLALIYGRPGAVLGSRCARHLISGRAVGIRFRRCRYGARRVHVASVGPSRAELDLVFLALQRFDIFDRSHRFSTCPLASPSSCIDFYLVLPSFLGF